MIPNSQIIVFPYPPEKPQQWFLELLISPSDNVKYVIIAVSSCIVGLGGIILFLHWKERREDEAEKRKAEHFFTF